MISRNNYISIKYRNSGMQKYFTACDEIYDPKNDIPTNIYLKFVTDAGEIHIGENVNDAVTISIYIKLSTLIQSIKRGVWIVDLISDDKCVLSGNEMAIFHYQKMVNTEVQRALVNFIDKHEVKCIFDNWDPNHNAKLNLGDSELSYINQIKEIARSLSSTLDDIRSCQGKKLLSVLRQANSKSDKFKEIFEDCDLDSIALDGSIKLNITDKKLLNIVNREIESKSIECRVLKTTGSSGVPFRFYRGEEDYWLGFARYLHVLKALNFYRIPRTYFPNPGLSVCKSFSKYNLITMEEAKLNASHHVDSIRKSKVEVIYSFPLFLQYIIEYLIDTNQVLPEISHVITVGDSIDGTTLRLCEIVFPNAIVRSTYGSTETGLMAYQCSSGLYHVIESDFCVYVQRDGQLHETGRGDLVITKLVGGGTPFINYLVGDDVTIVKDECLCGGKGKAFIYHGRSANRIKNNSGKLINTDDIDSIFMNDEDIFTYTALLKLGKPSIFNIDLVLKKENKNTKTEFNEKIRRDIGLLFEDQNIIVNTSFSKDMKVYEGNKRPLFTVNKGGD